MRKSWNEYFCDLATSTASRSTCNRLQVGAVVVRDKQIIATGYNGSIRGAKHCPESGCLLDNGHCALTVHAEVNALLSAARNGHVTEWCTVYVTHNPCLNCYKAMHQAGVKRIVYIEQYTKVDYSILGVNDNQAIEMIKLSDIGRLDAAGQKV